MNSWKTAVQRGVVSGSVASVLSAAALSARARKETGSPYAAINAVSHWLWGDRAFTESALSLRYTVLGYVVHHASATFWAVLHEKWFGESMDRTGVTSMPLTSLVTSGIACFTDYKLTPSRLKPGYETRLSTPSLFLVYCAFGAGLALGAHLLRTGDAVAQTVP